ncbi:MAG: gliding motility-associated ABC transporter substrate-binding protein GldG [Chitinophagales bacterium]|nr:gliding motility-associated ABC transporter substrate-binding protein GldG [Chitinophagales bacterium]
MVKFKSSALTNRRDALILMALVFIILLLANVVSRYFYFRLDLTAEKRYSISKPSKVLVKNLKDVVTVKVYLDGDLNAGFTRLKESTRNLLNEMRAYGGKNIEFEFIDPMAIQNLDERKALMTDLMQRGLSPTNLTTKSKTDSKQQLIFPGAIVTYAGREMPVQLLENQIGFSPQQILNNSEVLLEYKFANAIKKLAQYRAPRIAFLQGNEELNNLETADIRQTLEGLSYQVKDLDLHSNYHIANFDVIVIAKPRTAFEEQDLYKIDQFIMRGGKALWLVDGTNATMDSLKKNPQGQFVQANDFNLDNMLFKYGVRINSDVVQDINLNNPIPLIVGQMGNAPQTEMFPWYYFPLLVSDNNHAIIRNLDPVASFFASTIDTIQNRGVNKTILLHTTENAKAQLAPTRVHFGILQGKPNPSYYNQPKLPVAVLLEGEFESAFTNRLPPETKAAFDTVAELKPVDKSAKSKMIVIADGDIIRSEVRNDSSAYPLGYYMYTKQQFANKDFILNCIEYLIDDSGILETRNKEVKLRLLNKMKAEDEKLKWQLINIALPILLVILAGLGFGFYRRKRYAS